MERNVHDGCSKGNHPIAGKPTFGFAPFFLQEFREEQQKQKHARQSGMGDVKSMAKAQGLMKVLI